MLPQAKGILLKFYDYSKEAAAGATGVTSQRHANCHISIAGIATKRRSDPMTERSYQDAVQVLRDRLGGRWESVEAEGRDEMVAILKDQLGYDSRAANDAIDAMIQSGTLRYHRGIEHTGEDVLPAAPMAGGVPSGGGGIGAVPLAGAIATPGHWQIGPGAGDDSDTPGRAGQVTPS
jgi:hypothetical protein